MHTPPPPPSPLQLACNILNVDMVSRLLRMGVGQGENINFCEYNCRYGDVEEQDIYEDSILIIELLMKHRIFPISASYTSNERLLSLLLKYYPEKATEDSFLESTANSLGVRGLRMIKNRNADVVFSKSVIKIIVDYSCHDEARDGADDEVGEVCNFFGITAAECSLIFLKNPEFVSVGNFFRTMCVAKKIFGKIVLPAETIRSVFSRDAFQICGLFSSLIKDGYVEPLDESAKLASEELHFYANVVGNFPCTLCRECRCVERASEIIKKIKEL